MKQSRPTVVVTRRLPPAVTERPAAGYDARPNADDHGLGDDGIPAGLAGADGVITEPDIEKDAAHRRSLPENVKIVTPGRGRLERPRSRYRRGARARAGRHARSADDGVFTLPHIACATLETRNAMGFRHLDEPDELGAFFAERALTDLPHGPVR
jgi:hypothetical protein